MSPEDALGHAFRNPELLEQALTHASRAQDVEGVRNYERLEFLGDAVLDLVVAHELLAAHPDWREGELTRTRAALVNTRALAECARRLALGEHVRLGKSERLAGGERKESILAALFEAVVGAVYLDGGLEPVRALVRRLFRPALEAEAPPVERPAKMRLQEWVQTHHGTTPCYAVIDDSGDEQDPRRFRVTASAGDAVLGCGTGRTKREAERAAAADALARVASPVRSA